MFEVNSKPKNITIQKKNCNGSWNKLCTMSSKSHFSYDEIRNIYEAYQATYGSNAYIRIINEYNKTLLSSKSIDFCDMLETYDLITVKNMNENGVETYIKGNNEYLKNIRDFQRIIARHGGIARWYPFDIDKTDNFLICGRLRLRDEKEVTVAFH